MTIWTMRSAMSLAASMLAWMHAWSSPTYAGPVDTPLPTLSDRKAAVAAYLAAGVITVS